MSDFLNQYKGQSVEDAQAELAQVEAELEISQGINPQVIVRYKRLCKEVRPCNTLLLVSLTRSKARCSPKGGLDPGE